MQKLELHENKFFGTVPSEVGGMMALKDLVLMYNLLFGGIPSGRSRENWYALS